MFFFPFRAKNPPAYFPYATLGLIALNLVIFGITSVYFVVIRQDVLLNWAVTHKSLSLVRLVTPLFLHTTVFDLIVNSWFLWLVGPSVEGKLRPLKFVALYLLAGAVGNLLGAGLVGIAYPEEFCLGSTVAVMGVAGAFLYLSPFAEISVFYCVEIFLIGVREVQAQVVLVIFVVVDVVEGLLYGEPAGHLAHLGAAVVGFLIPMLFRVPRDTEEHSLAQSARVDLGENFELMSYVELEALMEHTTENIGLLGAYLTKALEKPGADVDRKAIKVIFDHRRVLLSRGDPALLAKAVLRFVPAGSMDAAFYLLVASGAEAAGALDGASRVYRRAFDTDPSGQDGEMALYRLALLAEKMAPDKAQAVGLYRELLQRFPHTEWASNCRSAIRRLENASAETTTVVHPASG